MKRYLIAVVLLASLSANAGVIRFVGHESVKGAKSSVSLAKHAAKFAWKVIY